MAETIENLFATIEHEQSALVTPIEEAVDDESGDDPERVAGRRAPIASTLQRLHHATQTIAGHRRPKAAGARFITKRA